MLDVINDTSNLFLRYKDAHSFNQLVLTHTPQTGSPIYYSYNGVSADGDTQVDVYPIPDGVYTLRFNVVQRTDDLVDDSDVLSVPAFPVELLAYAMAVEERGEDSGNTAQRAYEKALVALSDAISLDADKHPEETIWYVA